MDALALTDHGVLYGAIQFYLAAKEAGIKPIIGCEIYIALNNRLNHNAGEKNHYHLVLLAKNDTGYRNLLQLVTKAHLESFYTSLGWIRNFLPSITKDLLPFRRVSPAKSQSHFTGANRRSQKSRRSGISNLRRFLPGNTAASHHRIRKDKQNSNRYRDRARYSAGS